MIRLEKVTHKYFGYNESVLDISFDINKGEKLVIYGKGGSGKTTILKIIANLINPTSGSVTIDNKSVNDIKLKDRSTSMIFEDLAIPKYRVIRNTLKRPLKLLKVPRAEARKKVIDNALKFNITSSLDNVGLLLKRIDAVKVAVARAFIKEPDTILIDNPLKRLDLNERAEYFKEFFQHIYQHKGTIVYATDDIRELEYFSGRIVVLSYGSVQQIGSLIELIEDPKSVTVAKMFYPDMNFINAKIIKEKDKFMVTVKDKKYKVPESDKLLEEKNVIIGLSKNRIRLTEKGDYNVDLLYKRNDDICVCDSDISNEQIKCYGDTKLNRISLDLSSAIIYDYNSEEILYKY